VEKANPSAAPAQKTAESLPARSGVASAWQHNSARFGSFSSLQHALGNQALLGLLNSHRIQTKSRSGATDEFEAEADRAAEIVQTRTRAPGLQRKCAGGDSCTCAKCSGEEEQQRFSSTPPRIQRQAKDAKQPAAESAAETRHRQPRSHIVDDEAPSIAPGQMRKSAFIAQLRRVVCLTVDAALAGTPHSAQGCPYIEKWLAFYEGKDSQHLEHALLKYAPEAKAARVANDYILIVARRVHHAALRWAKTGQLTGIPDELARQVSGGGMFDSVGGFFSAVGSSVLGFLAGSSKNEEPAHEPIARKARDGSGAPSHDAGAVQAQLGSGRALDSGPRSRMESALGHDFSGVRIHTDSRAGSLSSDLNARAFTIGRDVAFGPGEYNPGTPVGDALLAHELAHVVQQGGGNGAPSAPMTKSTDQSAPSNQLEADADTSAIHAVTSMWIGAKHNLAAAGANAAPRFRSGLHLQRCPKPAQAPPAIFNRVGPSAPSEERGSCKGSAVHIVVRKSKDLLPILTTRASQAMLYSTGIEISVPMAVTEVSQHEVGKALLTWRDQSGGIVKNTGTFLHDWVSSGSELPVHEGRKIATDANIYGMSGLPGLEAREAAEKNGFDIGKSEWEFVENLRFTTTAKAGDKVLHHCEWGFRFSGTQTQSGTGGLSRTATVHYWGVDAEKETGP
jgi:hypothetical protein